MPHFCVRDGADEYICQECGVIECSKEKPPVWGRIPGTERQGNRCPYCVSLDAPKVDGDVPKLNKRERQTLELMMDGNRLEVFPPWGSHKTYSFYVGSTSATFTMFVKWRDAGLIEKVKEGSIAQYAITDKGRAALNG